MSEKKAALDTMASRKLKILALHGYRQSGEIFRIKTGSFRKLVKNLADFTYITAPHKVLNLITNDGSEPADETADNGYSWWFNRDDLTFKGSREGGPAIGFQESVEYVESVFKEHGPFDGILGFSQGASFASLLCYLVSKNLTPINFHFAILASGFKSGSIPHMKYYGQPICIPSLHIFGENDQIIPKEMSLTLKKEFVSDEFDPIEVLHDGGHFLPANSILKPAYIKFLKLMLLQIQEKDKQSFSTSPANSL
ncbi:esterase GA18864 [Chrysoperla carnea]|uniref:esterase GA18864 n=1 Tax=Chrysoperla carnea TaxID=189513 RepID=UPI001D08B2DB|nr:esterase GA18864 [Chrysoperla carnea]